MPKGTRKYDVLGLFKIAILEVKINLKIKVVHRVSCFEDKKNV